MNLTKKYKNKNKNKNYTIKKDKIKNNQFGGNEQELKVISNNGVPDKGEKMTNQCFWISLLKWIEIKNYSFIYENEHFDHNKLNVVLLKGIANSIKLD